MMKLRVVSASRGWHWVRMGIQLGARQPFGFMSLLGLFITGAMLMLLLPIIGPLLIVMAMPVVWMAFMLAAQRALAGERITPSLLIEPVRDPSVRKNWAQLGGMYMASTLLVMVLAGMLGPDLGTLAKALEEAENGQRVMDDPAVMSSMLWRLGLALPMALAFWHTPALLHWAQVPPLKALFFSAVACWRNLGAFVVYGLSWLAVLMAMALPLQLLAAMIPSPAVANILVVVGGMWVAACFYASLYFSVVECFEDSPGSAVNRETPSSGQA